MSFGDSSYPWAMCIPWATSAVAAKEVSCHMVSDEQTSHTTNRKSKSLLNINQYSAASFLVFLPLSFLPPLSILKFICCHNVQWRGTSDLLLKCTPICINDTPKDYFFYMKILKGQVHFVIKRKTLTLPKARRSPGNRHLEVFSLRAGVSVCTIVKWLYLPKMPLSLLPLSLCSKTFLHENMHNVLSCLDPPLNWISEKWGLMCALNAILEFGFFILDLKVCINSSFIESDCLW